MELYIYNRDMELQGIIDNFITLVWTRKYHTAGEVKLLCGHSEQNLALLTLGNLIMIKGKDEAAEIRYLYIKQSETGEQTIEVQGKMLSYWLGKRLILQDSPIIETPQNVIYTLVNRNITAASLKRKISNFTLNPNDEIISASTIRYTSEKCTNLQAECESIAAAYGIGFKVTTDRNLKRHFFSVYSGTDRTITQKENTPCVFSEEYDNIYSQEYEGSNENYKTVLYVGGEKREDAPQQIVSVGNASGIDRVEGYVDASGIPSTYTDENEEEVTIPVDEYRETLEAHGKMELGKYGRSVSYKAEINTNAAKYGVDYDLGDIVTCYNRKWNITMDARVTEAAETYQNGVMTLSVQFGSGMPTLFENIRTILKGRR